MDLIRSPRLPGVISRFTTEGSLEAFPRALAHRAEVARLQGEYDFRTRSCARGDLASRT